MVRFLVERGADVNHPNYFWATPFWGVCATGDMEWVKLFLKKGGDINWPGRWPDKIEGKRVYVQNVTPLMIAAENRHADVVKILLESGADRTMKDSLGRTAFEYAESVHDKTLLRLLSTSQ